MGQVTSCPRESHPKQKQRGDSALFLRKDNAGAFLLPALYSPVAK